MQTQFISRMTRQMLRPNIRTSSMIQFILITAINFLKLTNSVLLSLKVLELIYRYWIRKVWGLLSLLETRRRLAPKEKHFKDWEGGLRLEVLPKRLILCLIEQFKLTANHGRRRLTSDMTLRWCPRHLGLIKKVPRAMKWGKSEVRYLLINPNLGRDSKSL